MSDALLRELAERSGVQTRWTDQGGAEQAVSPPTLRAILAALGIAADNDQQIYNSLSSLEEKLNFAGLSRFTTARIGQPVTLPVPGEKGARYELTLENGARRVVAALEGFEGVLTLPPLDKPGYHQLHMADGDFTIATAPERCTEFRACNGGEAGFGLTAQIYALRSLNDGGIGNFAGISALGRAAAALGADALAISPAHALFGATPSHYSPYSPSTRLFYNPLYANPEAVFPADLVGAAIAEAGIGEEMQQLQGPLIDWERATPVRQRLLRTLYRHLETDERLQSERADFAQARDSATDLLRQHALFEVLHASELERDAAAWHWRNWQAGLQSPATLEVAEFAARHSVEIDYQIFLQWLTSRSYGEAQRVCKESGMGVGLIADLAIGMDGGGSHAWSRQNEVLHGLSIGAPPDYYEPNGQNWGLTTFSPHGLIASRFAPFIETLRASFRYAGGIRIDHVMGLSRLWMVPEGAHARDGAYVTFPAEILFRLMALESWRHGGVVLGEDLGTLPDDFRPYLRQQGIMGLRVLRFEKNDHVYFPPHRWDPAATAMTATHDLVSTAGWWAGTDIADHGGIDDETRAADEELRAWNRGILWGSFEREGLVSGPRPAPEDSDPVVDAAVGYIARTPCRLKLLTMEDALGMQVQPNVPGTTTERPNWRHRLSGDAGALLDAEKPRQRMQVLASAQAEPK